MVSYFLRYFSSTSTEQISPIPPDLSPVSIRLALLFLLLFASAGVFAFSSHSLFGIVSALTERGLDVLECWLKGNPDLKICLVVTVYPACPTRQADLLRLLEAVKRLGDKLSVYIRPLERITDRGTNALCFLRTPDIDVAHIVTGPSEDLGLDLQQKGQINFAFRADPALTEAFKRYFDWLWANSRDITANGVALIPDLVLPDGAEEAARQWQAYIDELHQCRTPQRYAECGRTC